MLVPDRQEGEVRIGSFKARASIHDLEPVSARDAAREHRHAHSQQRPTIDVDARSPGVQLDLRGRRVDEVRPELDQYLNDAYLNGMPTVRVVHGKGTGALRQVVRDQLASHPLVSSWGPAELKEGGEGATVARLAI
jgi:DNA mismatch repair protein MutS2